MSEERRQILEMLAEGKITGEEAERLLDKLDHQREQYGGEAPGEGGPSRMGKPKYLRVMVNSTNGDKVNVRVPMALIRTGLKLTTMLPPEASEKIKEHGIDLSQLSELQGDELIEALRELTVDVDSADGDTVRVYCE
jgi:hypothetical protein